MIPAPTPEQIALLERLDDVVKKRHAAPPSEKARIHEELSEVLTALVVSVLVKPKGIEARADSPRPRRHRSAGPPSFLSDGFLSDGRPSPYSLHAVSRGLLIGYFYFLRRDPSFDSRPLETPIRADASSGEVAQLQKPVNG